MARLGNNVNKKEELLKTHLMDLRTPVIEKCGGCDKIDGKLCEAYINPKNNWRLGNCSLATHIKIEQKKRGKIRVGQQKQRKRR